MRPEAAEARLPSPAIAFGPDFPRRLSELGARLALARERLEGRGRAGLVGTGEEFVGYRPYRPGEDVRRLDWGLYARLRKPWVRVTRRESSEEWCVLLDTSASMGTGVPGKLQRAAEIAVALVYLGVRQSAAVRVWISGADEPRWVRDAAGIRALMRALERRRATGPTGVAALLEPARVRGAGRVYVVGDFFDAEPDDVLRVRRRGAELACARVLAPVEIAPPPAEDVEWLDPESGASLRLDADGAARRRYEALLTRELERWRAILARHGVTGGVWSSATPFEDAVHALVAS